MKCKPEEQLSSFVGHSNQNVALTVESEGFQHFQISYHVDLDLCSHNRPPPTRNRDSSVARQKKEGKGGGTKTQSSMDYLDGHVARDSKQAAFRVFLFPKAVYTVVGRRETARETAGV